MRLIDVRTIAVAALALLLTACGPKGGAATGEDMVMGKADAPVTVIEYASVACPHCARFNNNVFPAIKTKYIDSGKVKWVSREMLTGEASVAAAGFLVARCAGKDKYFAVTDALYHSQDEMFADGTAANARAVLLRVAQSAGLTEAQFNTCVSDEKALNDINERSEKYGKRDNIQGTPSFMINNKIVASGEVTEADLSKSIDAALAKK